ncbi:hypothetical protein KI387_004447, partial [Taxus chinensis]
ITKPKVDKDEKILMLSYLESTRIPLGGSTPECEVHNLNQIVSRVIEIVEKGKQYQEQIEEHIQNLCDFIKSLLASDKLIDPTPLNVMPPPTVLTNEEVQVIKDIQKYDAYGKYMEVMVEG